MMTTVSVGATREMLIAVLEDVLKAMRAVPEGGHVDVTIYGDANDASGDEVLVTFSNDDMEGRPEQVIIDIERD